MRSRKARSCETATMQPWKASRKSSSASMVSMSRSLGARPAKGRWAPRKGPAPAAACASPRPKACPRAWPEIAVETEAFEKEAGVLGRPLRNPHAFGMLADVVEHRYRRIDGVRGLLEARYSHGVAALDGARCGGYRSRHEVEKARLSRAVGADDAEAGAGLDDVVDRVEHLPSAVKRRRFQDHGLLPEPAFGRREDKIRRRAFEGCGPHGPYVVLAALALRRPRSRPPH